MANIVRLRLELNPKDDDRESAFKKMFRAYVIASSDIGRSYRQKSTYESKATKKRRKKRESEVFKLKAKLKENFINSRQGKKQ